MSTGSVRAVDLGQVTWTVQSSSGRATVVAPGIVRADSVGVVQIQASYAGRVATRTLTIQSNPRVRLETLGVSAILDLADTVTIGTREILTSGAADTLPANAQRWSVLTTSDGGRAEAVQTPAGWRLIPRALGAVTIRSVSGVDTAQVATIIVAARPVALRWQSAPTTMAIADTAMFVVDATYADGHTATVPTDNLQWTVLAGTGAAQVLTPGRVTALRDGTVTVEARSGTLSLTRVVQIQTNQATQALFTPAWPTSLEGGATAFVTLRLRDRTGVAIQRPVMLTVTPATALRTTVTWSVDASGPLATLRLIGGTQGAASVQVAADSLTRTFALAVTPVQYRALVGTAEVVGAVGDTVTLPPALTIYDPATGQVLSGGPKAVRWQSRRGIASVIAAGVRVVMVQAGTDTVESSLVLAHGAVTDTVRAVLALRPTVPDVDPFDIRIDSTVPAWLANDIRTSIRSLGRVFTAMPAAATTLATDITTSARCAGILAPSDLDTLRNRIVISIGIIPAIANGSAQGGPCLPRTVVLGTAGAPVGPGRQAWVGRVDIGRDFVTLIEGRLSDPWQRDLVRVTVQHEVLHLLGVGTYSRGASFESGTFWNGPAALAAFATAGGVGPLPLSSDRTHLSSATFAGSGTLSAAFRPGLEEIMTGGPGNASMSRISLGILADLGYPVDVNRAPAYRLPADILAVLTGAPIVGATAR